MKNKKIIIILATLIVLIGAIFLVNNIYQNRNNITKNKSKKQNNLAIMIKEDGADNYSSTDSIPVGDYILNEEKTICENGGKVKSYDSSTGKIGFSFLGSDRCTLYFDYKESTELYKIIQKRYNEDKTYLGLYTGEDSDTYDYSVYYYKDNVENNNVLFAGFCWKIVRTTETGGVKLIYNGTQKDASDDYILLNQSEYTNLVNSSTYSYTFDETDKTWTSTNTGTNSSEISFSTPNNGDYVLNYDLSMYDYANYIYVDIFKNDISQGKFSGTTSGQLVFKELNNSDVIKVVFTRKYSYTSGSRNNIIFNFGKAKSIIKSCNNTGTDSQIGTSTFNSSYNSPAYVGYMYNIIYPVASKSMSSQSNIVFGSSFTYANGTYTLTSTKRVATWSSGYNTINSNHYTCLSTGTICTSLYYVYYTDSSTAYYITLTGGKSVDDAINEMLYNANTKSSTSSTIKTYIDTWYSNNMTSYTDMLEDTVFCNDRSMSNKTNNGWYPNGGSTSTNLQFKYYSIPTTPSLKCTNENDKFTVGTSNGNGSLTYPVGLLTVPEAKLANYGSSNYLNNGQYVWLASPYYFDVGSAGVRGVNSSGFTTSAVGYPGGIRPVISLKPGTEITSGDGSFTAPFVIE